MQIGSKQLSGALRAVFVIDAVESEAPDSPFEPFVGTRIDGGGLRELRVESRVKRRDLRDGAEHLRHNFHAFELGTIVKRSERGHVCDGGFYFWRDERGLLKKRAPVHDPMASDGDVRFIAKNRGRTIQKVPE